ncbi:RagB/SusD family nutrient uptake outer membrane protein [Saccharicrinis fermentans]|uniref:SusD family protein n=1 Tax=Saccharicrinis fermentans DSM 9555 = JCM 21142 TaxID=869213 RepID=W7YBX9_9BACT|nr:RagB/SusD family nutrient uptake outer membrane protein [Saccharicrinis fermentans]GAF01986.1 SusD family protein [Saccharicrinis fermentans DSM 9555 = JCM 21142]
MRKYILKIGVSLGIIMMLTASCDDYLELTPKDDLVQDEFWQNKEQVNSAVAGIYASMNESGFTERLLLWGEARAEMMVSIDASNNAQNMMKNYLVPTNGYVSWTNFYKTINYCNMVLAFADQAKENDPTFTELALNRYKAEAQTLRSLVYFFLVKNYKEIPLIAEATLSDQADFYPAKSSEGEVLNHITSDILAVIDYLPVSYEEGVKYDKGRLTKGAAYSILADIYLWQEKYDDCIEACQKVIDLQKYSLVEKSEWFNQIFFEGNSSEGIFELQFDDLFSTLRSYFYYFDPKVKPYDEIQDLFPEEVEDVRANRGSYDRSTGTVFKYAGVDAKAGTFRSYTEFYNTWIFYRYADVLLMQAEAYLLSENNKDEAKAYDLINQVHMRATGIPLEADNLYYDLLKERQKEFAFEGKRWYDLLRYARRNSFQDQYLITELVEIKAGADNADIIESYYSDTASYFLPIYQNEINLNSNLEQNPYYIN